jgi:hypothetical protein
MISKRRAPIIQPQHHRTGTSVVDLLLQTVIKNKTQICQQQYSITSSVILLYSAFGKSLCTYKKALEVSWKNHIE